MGTLALVAFPVVAAALGLGHLVVPALFHCHQAL